MQTATADVAASPRKPFCFASRLHLALALLRDAALTAFRPMAADGETAPAAEGLSPAGGGDPGDWAYAAPIDIRETRLASINIRIVYSPAATNVELRSA
jgi:hypothetical protein